jgi:DNA-binding NarL/FixJ family response regulator
VRVIIYAPSEIPSDIQSAILAGVDGYLSLSMLPGDMVKAVELILKARLCFFPKSAKEVVKNLVLSQNATD